MTVGFIDIDIVGNRRSVTAMLEHLDSALSPVGMSIFLNGRVSPYLRERARERFKGEGDNTVGHWKPLSEATQDWRSNYGFPPANPINKRTGALEEYITGAASNVTSGPGIATLTFPGDAPGDSLTAKKLKVAQRGIAYPRTPSRPVLGLGENELAFTLTQLALHIQGWDRSIA